MNAQNAPDFTNCTESKNVLVLGAAGTGKTFSYVFPVIKLAVANNKSLVITEVLGRCNELYDTLNPYLIAHGYEVKNIKVEDFVDSCEDIYSAMEAKGIDLSAPSKYRCAYSIMLSDVIPQSGAIAAKIIDALLYSLSEYADGHLEKDIIPIEFLLDEFQYIDPIPDFWKKIVAVRCRKISISIVLQYISQLQKKYPHKDWQHIAFTCKKIVSFSCSDPATANFISEYSNPCKSVSRGYAQGKENFVTMNYSGCNLKPILDGHSNHNVLNCINLPIDKLLILSWANPIALFDRNFFRLAAQNIKTE